MLKMEEIQKLIEIVGQSNIDEFEYEHEQSKIKLKKQGAFLSNQVTLPNQQPEVTSQVQGQQVQASGPSVTEEVEVEGSKVANAEQLHKVTSPMVGTFYDSSSPDADVYVKVGDKVKNETVVCIVEAMKLFNEIEAEVNGEIVEILAENGQLVEYGQPLFLVKPE